MTYLELIGVVGFSITAMLTFLGFLLKHASAKWIDAQFRATEIAHQQAHQERLKSLDLQHLERIASLEHEYKRIQERESLKFGKTYEQRWSAYQEIIKDLDQAISIAWSAGFNILFAGDRLQAHQLLQPIRSIGDRLAERTISDFHILPQECITKLAEVSMRIDKLMNKYREAKENTTIPIDADTFKLLHSEFAESVTALRTIIRTHIGGDLI